MKFVFFGFDFWFGWCSGGFVWCGCVVVVFGIFVGFVLFGFVVFGFVDLCGGVGFGFFDGRLGVDEIKDDEDCGVEGYGYEDLCLEVYGWMFVLGNLFCVGMVGMGLKFLGWKGW